jgi:hypothetical protein
VSVDIAGVASLFARTGSGTVNTGQSPVTGVPIAVAGPKNFITGSPQFQLDGTRSSGGILTYRWTYVPSFGKTATIMNENTATPTVSVPNNSTAQGDYTFQLTVTNAAGLSATDTVTVTYEAGFVPPQ